MALHVGPLYTCKDDTDDQIGCRITKSFVDFNGVVPEKFDVVGLSHKVEVEYGNVGVDFKFVPREGFGWMNSSFQLGLTYLNTQMRRALGTCTVPDLLFEKAMARDHAARTPQEELAWMERRRSSVISARQFTRNGSVSAAITRIGPTSGSDSTSTSPLSSPLGSPLGSPRNLVPPATSSDGHLTPPSFV